MIKALGAGIAALAIFCACAAPGPVEFRTMVSGLASPLEVVHAGDGSRRLFVVEQEGRVRIVKDGALVPTPFLDIRASIASGGEQGLLGLAFHPQYASNGRFFVFYNRPRGGSGVGSELVIARYQRSAADADLADPASGAVLMVIDHPDAFNHNGGKIAFGRDGYLYIAVGDGGGGGDPFNAGQNLADLRAKLLRIDVDQGTPYGIPAGNPFIGTAGARPEVFAYGLRNPFRFNFDRATGDLFIGDVGQNAWEEIDFIAAGSGGGHNFGWNRFEGTHCYQPPSGCALAGHVPPILEYGHDSNGGFSVIGGVRYRGPASRELRDYYVYGDFVSGHIWAASQAGGTWSTALVGSLPNVSSFGEDEAGEIYATDLGAGRLLRLVAPDTTGDIFTNSRLFAMQQYRDFLSREGDAAGVDFWAARIDAGQPRANVIASFLALPEFQGFIAPVARLYFAYFLRIPDYQGLTYWIGRFRAGDSLESIADYFAASPEFSRMYGTLDNGAFVDRVYMNVLGRAADASGRAFWVGELDSGRRTRGALMAGFSESAEYRALIAPEVFVTSVYSGMMKRAPDPDGFNFWVDYMDHGNSGDALIDGFLASAEYRNRFPP